MKELTLEEYINELPEISLAQKEYSELKQKSSSATVAAYKMIEAFRWISGFIEENKELNQADIDAIKSLSDCRLKEYAKYKDLRTIR